RFSPSGNWTKATGARVSPGTRILTTTNNCPVLVRMAFCSIAHSSGASRLALLQGAAQLGVAEAGGEALGEGDGAGVAWAAGVLDLGACWASPSPAVASNRKADRASRAAAFTDRPLREVARMRQAVKASSLGGLLDGAALRNIAVVVVLRASPVRKRVGKLVEIEIDDRRREQGQRLADE